MHNRLLSSLTRNGLTHSSGDYISRDHDELGFINNLKNKYSLKDIYRFDIGKNTDGFAPSLKQALKQMNLQNSLSTHFTDYPDNQHIQLRRALARRFNLKPEMFLLSAGLESVIDHLARACLNPHDRYLIPVPNFSVFEDMSARISSNPIHVPIGNNLRWTDQTTENIIEQMERSRPKIIWISNPINPTGQLINLNGLKKIITCAGSCDSLIVIDEAYGEYADTIHGPHSAARFVPDNRQLVVLRTFSKLYGLPSARVGYLISSSPELRSAVRFYRPMFPLSWLSLKMTQLALEDENYLEISRQKLRARKYAFVKEMEKLHSFETVKSDVNTIMIRHRSMSADELSQALNRHGIITANLNNVGGIVGKRFLRMTIRCHKENMLFIKACMELENYPGHGN